MDNLVPFKDVGGVKLTVPLAQGFEKVLLDFVQLAIVKSGFGREESSRIAQRISGKAFDRLPCAKECEDHQQVEVSLAHRPGQITIRIAIPCLEYSEEEDFKSS